MSRPKNLIQRNEETKKQRKKEKIGRGKTRKNAAFLFFVFCFLFSVPPVFAHGGGIIVVGNEPVGAYAVSVWVNPPVPRTNETLHMTVGIAGAELEPILDAAVRIDIFEAGSDILVTSAPATTAQSVNRLFYETDFPRIEPGDYDVVVRVDGTAGSGDVVFEMEMKPASGISWVVAGLVGVGVIVVGFVVYSWRQQDRSGGVGKRPSSINRPPRKKST
ncbi:MAG: hypothetical protein DWQ04_12910 [Chloroflexi bacterium]|nr:MAG: hypothetical protein DWQ04_12910 [Chloroflexota bacterium]